MLIAEELPLQHFFGARVIGTLHEASVWLCGFTIGAAHRLPIESANPRGSKPLSFQTHEDAVGSLAEHPDSVTVTADELS